MSRKRVRHHANPLADRTEHSFAGFDNDYPIIVDIGADHGEFIQQLLEKWGDKKNFILFEIRKLRTTQLQEKFAMYDNVVVFDGDVVRNFANVIKPSLAKGAHIEEIYINFPDPWFKERHKKRRVVKKEFIMEVQKWLPSTTQWYFQTDQKHLFMETIEDLRAIDGVHISFFTQSPYGVTTKWEIAKMRENKKIYRMKFTL